MTTEPRRHQASPGTLGKHGGDGLVVLFVVLDTEYGDEIKLADDRVDLGDTGHIGERRSEPGNRRTLSFDQDDRGDHDGHCLISLANTKYLTKRTYVRKMRGRWQARRRSGQPGTFCENSPLSSRQQLAGSRPGPPLLLSWQSPAIWSGSCLLAPTSVSVL